MRKKILVKSLILASSLVFFSGCAGKVIDKTELYIDKNRTVGYELIQTPKLNIENTVEIGENIYSKINKYINTTNTVTLKDNGEGQYSFGWFTVDCKFNTNDTALLELWEQKQNSAKVGKCFNNGSGTYIEGAWANLVDANSTGYFTHLGVFHTEGIFLLKNKIKYTVHPTIEFKEDSFKYVALYQGKTGNKIKISFREFKDDMARPAFTQDIEYDLEKDGTAIIGFKGLRIEVVKATNTDITYKVVKDYN